MPLHLKKLCVGADTIEDLAASIKRRKEPRHQSTGEPFIWTTTRSRPKRDKEIIGQGASLYWIINRLISVRQEILAFRPGTRADGVRCIHIDLDHQLHLVKPRPHRPFQGWRYLEDADAPADLFDLRGQVVTAQDDDVLPPVMTRELASLGLI